MFASALTVQHPPHFFDKGVNYEKRKQGAEVDRLVSEQGPRSLQDS